MDDTVFDKWQAWRNEDHEDKAILSRHEIITLLAEIERLQAHKRKQAADIMTLGQEVGSLRAEIAKQSSEIERLWSIDMRGLKDEIDRLQRLQAHKRKQAADIMTLGQEVGRLQAALRQYGDHTYECTMKEDNTCNCGYSASIGLVE